MINITKSRTNNSLRYSLVIPVLLSAMLLAGNLNAVAKDKAVETETQSAVKNAAKKEDETQSLMKDLIKEKVITGKEKNLFIKLNFDELLVNSKIMPEGLHKRMRAKYLAGNPRKTITYKISSN